MRVRAQAVKDRRQKTLAAKQAELQSNMRDEVALLQAAINDRVRGCLRLVVLLL